MSPRALSARLGRDIRVDVMDWDAAQQKVLRGEADGLLSMSMSPERQALFDFTDSTITHDFGIFVRRGDLTIHGAGDLGRQANRRDTPGGFPRRVLESPAAVDLVFIQNYEDGFDRLAAGTHRRGGRRSMGRRLHPRAAHGCGTSSRPDLRSRPSRGGIAVRKGTARAGQAISTRRYATSSRTARSTQIQERWRPQEMLFVSRQRVTASVKIVAEALCVARWRSGC